MKPQELNVDFIGGQVPLTKDEEKAISDFIRKRKSKKHILKTKSKRRKSAEIENY